MTKGRLHRQIIGHDLRKQADLLIKCILHSLVATIAFRDNKVPVQWRVLDTFQKETHAWGNLTFMRSGATQLQMIAQTLQRVTEFFID